MCAKVSTECHCDQGLLSTSTVDIVGELILVVGAPVHPRMFSSSPLTSPHQMLGVSLPNCDNDDSSPCQISLGVGVGVERQSEIENHSINGINYGTYVCVKYGHVCML